MNYRQVETSREIRLWLGQILVPAVTLLMLMPKDTRDEMFDGAKRKFKKFTKKEEA